MIEIAHQPDLVLFCLVLVVVGWIVDGVYNERKI